MQLHPAHGVEQRLAADGQPVRVAGRDQPAVVRELALDQPGGEARAVARPRTWRRARRGAASPRSAAAEQPLELLQRTRRHQHASGPRAARWCRAGRARPAGRSRWPPAAARRPRRQQHAGEDRPGVVAARRRHDLAQRLGELRASRVTASLGRAPAAAGTRRPGAARIANCEAPGGDVGLVVVDRRRDRAGLERPHDVGRELGRAARPRRRLAPSTCAVDRDRQVEVGAGELQVVARQLEPDTGQHRQRAAPAGDGPAGGGEASTSTSRSHRNFTLSSLPLRCVGDIRLVVVVGPVDCGRRSIAAGQRPDFVVRVVVHRFHRSTTAAGDVGGRPVVVHRSSRCSSTVVRRRRRRCADAAARRTGRGPTWQCSWPFRMTWMSSVTWS